MVSGGRSMPPDHGFPDTFSHTPTDSVVVRVRRPRDCSRSPFYDGSETECRDDCTICGLVTDWKNRRGRRRPL
jgi:hypothetical protein